ncbi:MAG: hypothetical protein M0002_13380, partial [Rhodospirillales bacterium]|nr:hypothetical protein [Rhodospirillales bacterium]
ISTGSGLTCSAIRPRRSRCISQVATSGNRVRDEADQVAAERATPSMTVDDLSLTGPVLSAPGTLATSAATLAAPRISALCR